MRESPLKHSIFDSLPYTVYPKRRKESILIQITLEEWLKATLSSCCNISCLLILDELVSGLDPVGVRDMRELLRQLKTSGMSIFLNSHQLADVEALCDRVAIINQGQILKVGAPATLFSSPSVLEIRVSQVSPELLRRLRAIAIAIEPPRYYSAIISGGVPLTAVCSQSASILLSIVPLATAITAV